MRAASVTVRALGPARYPLADAGGLAAWAVMSRRRRRAVANHRRAAPGIDTRQARRLARASFREYGRTSVDFVWANGMSREEVLRRSWIDGLEHIRAAEAAGRSSILALGHHGNWDMAAHMAVAHDLSLTTVMGPIAAPWVTNLVAWARQQIDMEVYTPERAARGLLRAIRQGRCIALLCDIPGGGPTVEVQYCGGPVRFSSVPAWLAMRTGAALLPVACFREGRGRHRIVVHPEVPVHPDDDEARLTGRLAAVLEGVVRERPAQWYPFGPVYADAGAP